MAGPALVHARQVRIGEAKWGLLPAFFHVIPGFIQFKRDNT